MVAYRHRDQTASRGAGDPGDAVFEHLAADGYERFDFGAEEDLTVWRRRQHALGVTADGIPGPATAAAVRALQLAHGLEDTGLADASTRALLDSGPS